MQRTMSVAVAGALALLAGACQKAPEAAPVAAADAAFATTLQERLLDAKPGDVIEIPAGRHVFDRSLSLRADGVTIRGAGMDTSVLSFKGQKAGAEGLLVNGDDFTIENLTIEPRISAAAVDVHPAYGFVSVLLGAALFGVAGALLAVPVGAMALALTQTYVKRHAVTEDAGVTSGDPPESETA